MEVDGNLSIVVASHKYSNHLTRCLISIRNIFDGEVIVVDDQTGYPDSSIHIFKKVFNARFITTLKPQNLGANLNQGIRESSCDNILILSHDMILDDKYMLRLSQYDHLDKKLVYGDNYILSPCDESGEMSIDNKQNRFKIPSLGDVMKDPNIFARQSDGSYVFNFPISYWTVCDAFDTLIRKNTWRKNNLPETYEGFPSHAYPEWLFKVWLEGTQFIYDTELVTYHQYHPRINRFYSVDDWNKHEELALKSAEKYKGEIIKSLSGLKIQK